MYTKNLNRVFMLDISAAVGLSELGIGVFREKVTR